MTLASIRPGLPPREIERRVDAGLAAYDRNGDGRLCVEIHRNPAGNPKTIRPDLIDNTV